MPFGLVGFCSMSNKSATQFSGALQTEMPVLTDAGVSQSIRAVVPGRFPT